MDPGLERTLAQQVLLDLGRLLFGTLFRLRREGLQHVPTRGPVLVVSSHPTLLDPLLLALAMPRRFSTIAEAAPWRYPSLGYLFDVFDTIPLERGPGAVTALRAAMRRLADGGCVVMFPEGGISVAGELRTFQGGAARLALEVPCTVIPAALCGTAEAMPPGRTMPRFRPVTVRFGAPLDLTQLRRRRNLADADAVVSAVMHDAVAELYTPDDPRTRRRPALAR